MKFQILSDNMDEPNLKDALKKKEINEVHNKLRSIIHSGGKIVSQQKAEMKEEDLFAGYIIENTKTLNYLAYLQIAIIVVIAIYQVFSFRSYLASHDKLN